LLGSQSQQDLIAAATNPTAKKESRIAAAVLLLKSRSSQQAIDAAFGAINLEMPAGLNDWEESTDWTLSHPVAAEASLHLDLMPQFVQRILSGEMSEAFVGFVLRRYQSAQANPQGHLAALLKSNMQPYQRQRCERLIALLKGETLATTVNVGANQPAETAPTTTQKPPPIVQTSAPKKAPEAKPSSTPSEEPTSSTPWSIIVVLIVSALGLLWLVLKRRS
jgi:hypothetical protein